ncbi:hypothetical protein [Allocoleopsis sp.]|uniref:hypothetical protein n=1 Tax=Allocoleopsis sp. TaxID=3088169 RepID=UPI002FCF58D4
MAADVDAAPTILKDMPQQVFSSLSATSVTDAWMTRQLSSLDGGSAASASPCITTEAMRPASVALLVGFIHATIASATTCW